MNKAKHGVAPFVRHIALLAFAVSSAACAVLAYDEKPKSQSRPLSPPQALKSFQVHNAFRMELVASEPAIRDPVAMAFAEDGAMFVVEFPQFNEYRFPRGVKPKGAVKRLVDADGDGTFERVTIFAKDIPFATAVICFDGGVLVGAAPDILFFKDNDGDGRADVRRVVLTGFARDFAGGGLINSFHWGLDNRIHIATSFAGGEIRRPNQPKQEAQDIRGRGVAFDPRNGDFELTSGGGQHGMGVDNWGRRFLCSNVFPMQHIVYESRYADRNPWMRSPAAAIDINAAGDQARVFRISPLEPWRVTRSRGVADRNPTDEGAQAGGRFTSSSGITIYRGDAWPAAMRNQMFVGEVTNNLVFRAQLKQRGVELRAHRADKKREFLSSRDPWFRPVQMANGPDGNLYVVDMYRELIEGAAFVPADELKGLDPSRGIDRGRIYRLVPKDYRRAATRIVPRSSKTSHLVSLLEHPNGWHRDTAMRLLYERNDPTANASLLRLVQNGKSATARLHALMALRSARALTTEAVLQAIRDENPHVRRATIQVAEQLANDSPTILAQLLATTNDTDVSVRFQLALTLGEISDRRRFDALASLARRDHAERWVRFAIQSSLAQDGARLFERLAFDEKFRDTNGGRQLLLNLSRQIGVRNDPSELAVTLNVLTRLARSEKTLADSWLSVLLTAAPNGKARSRLSSRDATQVNDFVNELVRNALLNARKSELPIATRIHSIRTLKLADMTSKSVRTLFAELLDTEQPPAVQVAALRTLEESPATFAVPMILDRFQHMTPAVRSTAVEVLLSDDGSAVSLLKAIRQGDMPHSAVTSAHLSLLAARSTKLNQLVSELKRGENVRSRQSVINQYASATQGVGNATRGRRVFREQCAACHRLHGEGRSVGADLRPLTARRRRTILTHILDPNRDVKPKFVNYSVQSRKGRVISGMIIKETATDIELQRLDGSRVSLQRVDVASVRASSLSFMPEGLEKKLSIEGMRDLLEFIRRPGKK